MATDTSIEVAVVLESDGFKTRTVRGKRASCTYDAKLAVERLADKLFPDFHKTIERMPCTAIGTLHSKWRISPGELINQRQEV